MACTHHYTVELYQKRNATRVGYNWLETVDLIPRDITNLRSNKFCFCYVAGWIKKKRTFLFTPRNLLRTVFEIIQEAAFVVLHSFKK